MKGILIISFVSFGVSLSLETLVSMFFPEWSYPEKNKKIKVIKLIIICIIIFSLTYNIKFC